MACAHALVLVTSHTNSFSRWPTQYSLTRSLTRSFTHSPALSLTQSESLTRSLTHSLSRSLTRSPTHSLTHSFTHALSHSLPHSLTHSPARSLNSILQLHMQPHHSPTQPSSWCLPCEPIGSDAETPSPSDPGDRSESEGWPCGWPARTAHTVNVTSCSWQEPLAPNLT